MPDASYVQFSGALLFCLAFVFLWRRSGVVYLGYWALAGAAGSGAGLFSVMAHVTGSPGWHAPEAVLESGFALCVVAAARADLPERAGSAMRWAVRVLYLFPPVLLVLAVARGSPFSSYSAARAMLLGAIYLFSFRRSGDSSASRLFYFTLLALGLLHLQCGAYLFLSPAWMSYLEYSGFYDLALKTLLTFAAMAVWIESLDNQVAQMGNEFDALRKTTEQDANLDRLTGVLNQDSLQRRMEKDEAFRGVAAVCDLDNFKSINDRFGHTVGDEVLRDVGHLLRNSIRGDDCAYRWGGDEFALLFNEQDSKPARERMRDLEARLNDFRVRGHGSLLIRFSWGVAEGLDAPLREVLARADQEMYANKRARAQRDAAQPTGL